MNDGSPSPFPSLTDLERRHAVPPDTCCRLSPEDMSLAIAAKRREKPTEDLALIEN